MEFENYRLAKPASPLPENFRKQKAQSLTQGFQQPFAETVP